MSSMWNNGIKISVFGESHSPAIGVTIDNLPAGKKIDTTKIAAFLRRRQARSDGTTTSRIEADIPEILCGISDGTTNGTPICIVIKNNNIHSSDYNNLQTTVRPGHADFTGFVKYHGANDIRGGGHFSGRLTACLVAAGAVCGQILEQMNVFCVAHLLSVQDISAKKLDELSLTEEKISRIRSLTFPVIDEEKREEIAERIKEIRLQGNSVGGTIECIAVGVAAGIGAPMIDNLESLISSLIFAIPGVKGIEFGNGFDCTRLLGSENNDEFYIDNTGEVKTKTNNHGGILGGISSGMPIRFTTAFKPTPSIAIEQNTVDVLDYTEKKLTISGRHDPCIAVRAVPVVEACCNIVLLGQMI